MFRENQNPFYHEPLSIRQRRYWFTILPHLIVAMFVATCVVIFLTSPDNHGRPPESGYPTAGGAMVFLAAIAFIPASIVTFCISLMLATRSEDSLSTRMIADRPPWLVTVLGLCFIIAADTCLVGALPLALTLVWWVSHVTS